MRLFQSGALLGALARGFSWPIGLFRNRRAKANPKPKPQAQTPLPKPQGKRPVPVWRLWGMTAQVWTKSEARACFKRALGLKRLPPGVKVRRWEAGEAIGTFETSV